jgi:hypothetical protein
MPQSPCCDTVTLSGTHRMLLEAYVVPQSSNHVQALSDLPADHKQSLQPTTSVDHHHFIRIYPVFPLGPPPS